MKNYTFYWELKNLIVQFMKALDDCVIKRYDDNRVEQDSIEVRVMYSPKSRTLYNLVNKQQVMELPVISVSLGGIQRNPQRAFNKIDGPTMLQETLTNPLQPIPVSITMNVSILTKYQNDMDQIVSNMIPYFDPYIVLSWKHPEMEQEIRSKVEWSGNINYSYPNDVAATIAYRQSADMTFTIEGWLFKKSEEANGIIHTIITDFIGVKDMSEIERAYYDPTEYDRFVLSGIPVVTEVKPIYIEKDTENTLYLSGLMLDKADAVYISGSMFPQTTANYVDVFSNSTRLSANNPPFYGTQITTYETVGNAMIVELPMISDMGLLDIIILNQAGYGGVIKNSKTTNLWRCGISVYNTIDITEENIIFIDSDSTILSSGEMIFEQTAPILFTNNPTNYRYYTPIYRLTSDISGAQYSQTVFGNLENIESSVDSNKFLKLNVGGSSYYMPIYSELISEIVTGIAGIKIDGVIESISGEINAVGYLGFNYGDYPAYILIYSLA